MAEPNSDAISAPNLAAFSSPSLPLEGRVVKRRNRIPVSCGPCRTRRSKCDRNLPCSSCDKRGEGHLCSYAKAGDKHKKAPEGDGKRHNPPLVQDRLQYLENLVLRLVSKEQNATGQPSGVSPYQDASTASSTSYPPATSSSGALSDSAALPPTGTGTGPGTGTGGTSADSTPPHWSAILNGIQELRNAIHHEEQSADSIFDTEDRPLLLAAARPVSLSALLSDVLPPRSECDRRLTQYFRTPYITINVVHSALFEEEYRQFWLAPDNADPVWCALLFALLALSAHISTITGISSSADPNGDPSHRFAHAAAACLNMVGYSRPRPFLLPALLLLAQWSYIREYDPTAEVGMIVSIATRLAFQAGIHREPQHHSSTTSVFDAEINRRLWVMLRHFDLQTASQFGIPASIPPNSFDVQEPRNLLDNDLSPEITVLPPSRPYSDATPLTSFLLKHRLMNLFGTIYSNACSPWDSLSDADVQRLDAEVHQVKDNFPIAYRWRPVESSFTIDHNVVMARVTCELLAQKSICILHRRRMGLGNADSHSACTKAAGAMVETMTDFVASLKPGGALEGQAWMITSTNVNDLLLASMVLVMGTVLEDKQKRVAKKEIKWSEEHIQLLSKARALCADFCARSKGAKRVVAAIDALFHKAGTERDENLDPSLHQQQQQQQFSGTNANSNSNTLPTSASTMSMSTDAMSSLAAAAAQLSPESSFVHSATDKQNSQAFGGAASTQGYAWATASGPTSGFDGSSGGSGQQHASYPGHFIQGSPLAESQSPTAALDVFEQLVGAIGGDQSAAAAAATRSSNPSDSQQHQQQRGEIDWSAFDQFLVTGDPLWWSGNV